MLIINMELNNMSKQADHNTLAKFFTIPKNARTILDEIDRQLIKVTESIDEASYGYDGTREPSENDVKDILGKLQKIINKYKGE
tara:strand:- start:159 stop:410 length:252 start_codon:yes stop_codon:yes gene_type:complete